MTTTLETTKVREVRYLFYLSAGASLAAAIFCVLFIAILLTNYYAPYSPEKLGLETPPPAEEPLLVNIVPYLQLPTEYPEFVAMKARLAQDDSNEELRENIRELDRKLRIEYFKRREASSHTSPYLLLAAVVMFASARIATTLNRRLPKADSEDTKKNATGFAALAVLYGIGVFAAVFVGIAVGFIVSSHSETEQFLQAKLAEVQKEAEQEKAGGSDTTQGIESVSGGSGGDPTTTEGTTSQPFDREAFLVDYEKYWPAFRGPEGSGISKYENIPLEWDVESGKNILWKSEVPLPGHNSPVVWGDRLFLAGADENNRKVFCYDIADGKLLWEREAPSTPESRRPITELDQDTSFSAPSMVCDGKRVYAIFANCDLVAVDFDGNVVWSKSLGLPNNHYGFSASLAIFFDRIIIQSDQGEAKDGISKIFALNGADGSPVWETKRPTGASWPSPIVRKVGERWQLLTAGDAYVISYDPEDGKELWRCKCLMGETGPSPTAFGTHVYAATDSAGLVVLDGDSNGEIPKDDILWTGDVARPNACSPLVNDKFAFTLEQYAYFGCYDVNEKTDIWELELGSGDASFYSSPAMVGDKVFLFSKDEEEDNTGKCFIIDLAKAKTAEGGGLEPDAEAAMVTMIPMGEGIYGSPAFQDGRMYIRGTKHVFCIGGE